MTEIIKCKLLPEKIVIVNNGLSGYACLKYVYNL